tara:strand:- start:521 stop:1327 length:807 start_codon:yes stop_codon:yes gene_type:complete
MLGVLSSNSEAQSLSGENLPEPAREFLMDALTASGLSSGRVSSFERTAKRQAELLLGVIKDVGVVAAKVKYGDAADKVIDIYIAKKDLLTEPALIQAMTDEVNAQVSSMGPGRKQMMHIPPTNHYTFDVAPSSILNKARFKQELQGHPEVVPGRFFPPDVGEKAFHIELPKTLNTISGTWNGSCTYQGDTNAFKLKLRRVSSGYKGGLEGNGSSVPFTKVSIDRRAKQIRFTMNDEGDIVNFTGNLGNLNKSINVTFTPGNGKCRWTK